MSINSSLDGDNPGQLLAKYDDRMIKLERLFLAIPPIRDLKMTTMLLNYHGESAKLRRPKSVFTINIPRRRDFEAQVLAASWNKLCRRMPLSSNFRDSAIRFICFVYIIHANIIFSSLSSSWTIQCSAHRASLSVDTARAVMNHLHLPCMYVSQVDRTCFLSEQLGKCEVKTIFLISNAAEGKAPQSASSFIQGKVSVRVNIW